MDGRVAALSCGITKKRPSWTWLPAITSFWAHRPDRVNRSSRWACSLWAWRRANAAYYTAPYQGAGVSEKFFDLVQVLGRDNVGMITGDTHINTTAPVICCTAEILANDALREGEDADVGCVAMDEFHYFADPDRGWAWQVPLLTLPHTQFMLMSATLGDVSAIAASLRGTHRQLTSTSWSTRRVPCRCPTIT